MSEKNAVFGLFTNDKASHVFKDLGKIAKKSAGETNELEVAVKKASDRSIKASEAQRAAQAKAKIAQTQYNEVMAKGNATESQRLIAHERLTSALNRSDAANIENEASVSALTAAEARATFQTTELGNANHFANSKMGSLIKTAAAGAAAFAAYEVYKFGKQSVTAAEDFQASQTKLETSIKNSGHSWKEYAKPVAEANAQLRKYGYTDAQTQDALAVLTTSLNDPAKAMKYLGTVADLARHQNLSLSDSALLVAKGYEGQIRPLRAMGIDTGVAASGVLKIKTAHDELIKAQTRLHQIQSKGSTIKTASASQDRATIKAQEHLATLENKYGNSLTRTVAQTNALERARERANKTQATSTTQSFAVVNAQTAVNDAQQKYNDALHAGDKILEAVSTRMKGSAANSTKDLKVQQAALNAELDHEKILLGEKLLPDLSKLTVWMTNEGIPDMEHFGHFLSSNKDLVEALAGGLGVFYVGSKLTKGMAAFETTLKGISTAGAASGDATVAAWGPMGLIIAGIAAAFVTIDKLTSKLDPQKTKVKGLENGFNQLTKITGISNAGGSAGPSSSNWSATPSNQLGPWHTVELSNAPGNYGRDTPGKYGTYVHVEVHGSVVSEKKLIDAVHTGIAQKMVRAGKDPKVIGK